MFLILKLFLRLAHDTFVSEKGIDPRTSHYPLVSTPWSGLCIVVSYLLFVNKLGPEWMKNRKPYNLKFIISIYNLFQIVMNTIIFCMGILGLIGMNFNLLCQEVNYIDTRPYTLILLKATYFYYLMKYADLLDSIFFVLRKKSNQLSFLHIYHHTLLIVAVYYNMRHYTGSHPAIMGIINSFVHVVMYGYYFLSTYKPGLTKVWWKKYLTIIQLTQFVIVFIHFSLPLYSKACSFPTQVCFIGMTQAVFMMALFSDFYIRAYIWPKKKLGSTN